LLTTTRPTGNRIALSQSPFKADRFHAYTILLLNSGTAALAAALSAAIHHQGKSNAKPEVLIPAYACPDLISAILYAGAIPILVEIQANSPFLSTKDLESKITPNSIALIAVNFLGLSEQVNVLGPICNKHDLFLINDSAQFFPKLINSSSFPGDVTILSFGRGKPINLLHGGAVVTNNTDIVHALGQLQISDADHSSTFVQKLKISIYNIVIRPLFYGLLNHVPGLNIGETIFSELPSIRKMDNNYSSLLEANINQYNASFNASVMIHQKLASISDERVIDLFPADELQENMMLLRYPVLITDKTIRDTFADATPSLGVSTLYQRPLSEIKGLEKVLDPDAFYPNASNFADHLVTLPTHEDVDEELVDTIIFHLQKALSSRQAD